MHVDLRRSCPFHVGNGIRKHCVNQSTDGDNLIKNNNTTSTSKVRRWTRNKRRCETFKIKQELKRLMMYVYLQESSDFPTPNISHSTRAHPVCQGFHPFGSGGSWINLIFLLHLVWVAIDVWRKKMLLPKWVVGKNGFFTSAGWLSFIWLRAFLFFAFAPSELLPH
jgi:hypothetical protein